MFLFFSIRYIYTNVVLFNSFLVEAYKLEIKIYKTGLLQNLTVVYNFL